MFHMFDMKINFLKILATGTLAVLLSFTLIQKKTTLYIIGDSTAANKTYYYIVKAQGRNLTGQIANFGGPWAENVITWRSMP